MSRGYSIEEFFQGIKYRKLKIKISELKDACIGTYINFRSLIANMAYNWGSATITLSSKIEFYSKIVF